MSEQPPSQEQTDAERLGLVGGRVVKRSTKEDGKMSEQPHPSDGSMTAKQVAWEMSEQPQHCPGPRQHGHPLTYESHCDHGETKAHDIQQREPPQEWTPEYVQSYFGWEDKASQLVAQRLADAHNAALAAERKADELERHNWQKILNDLSQQLASATNAAEEFFRINGTLTQQVDAERERAEGCAHTIEVLEDQLVAERTEKIELNNAIVTLNDACEAAQKQRDDFRRALEQRIGEMDELRAALKEMAQSVPLHPRVLDALAKEKEEKLPTRQNFVADLTQEAPSGKSFMKEGK